MFAVVILSLPKISVGVQTTEDLQRGFTELRFGMFIHHGILTFTNAPRATPYQDPDKFFPKHLNCEQWAAAEAKMKFAILTTKHHDVFCLWKSKSSVTSSPWKNGKGDVVREFVNVFSRHNIYPCFYYSIWDNTAGIGYDPITHDNMKVIKGQIAEMVHFYFKLPSNCDGSLDSNIAERLNEVGKAWIPDAKRPPLQKHAKFIEKPVMPDSAWATSGIAKIAIDGINNRYYYSVLQSDSSLPRSIIIDLDKKYKCISILNYVPKFRVKATPVNDGSIKSHLIYSSKDNKNFTKIAACKWDSDTKMKVVTFPPVTACYIKVSALSAVNG